MSAKSPDVDFDVSLAPEDSWDVDVEVVVAGMVTWLILVFLAGQGVPE